MAPGALCVGGIDTAAFLRQAVDTITALHPAPDLVLCTGDLVNDGTDEQYRHLRHLLKPIAAPLRLVCGNHDDRAAMRRVFADHTYLGREGPCAYVVDELEPLRLIVLDTLVPRRPYGRLDAEQLAWLDHRLAEAPDRPTVVALHHPPFATGIRFMDGMGLDRADAAALATVIERYPCVERVVEGHLHRSITRRFAGTVAATAPSCSHAVDLDLDPAAVDGRWTYEPPAIVLHHWSPTEGLVSHVRPTGSFPSRLFGE